MYQVQMQYIPGINVAWVAKINSDDPIYQYENEEQAINQANELESQDNNGRKYRVQKIG